MLRRALAKSAILLSLLVLTALPACGGGQEVKHATLKPGDMPSGGEWQGVYYSQVYGYLHLTEEGGAVTGAWRNTAGDKWGELAGETDGSLLRFQWQEHTIGAIGANAESKGHGVFKYLIPTNGDPHKLTGQWGLGENECCQQWDSIKQMNREPDPKSVRPDEIEGRVSGGGWDDEDGGGDGGSEDGEGSEEEESEGSSDDDSGVEPI